MEFNIGSTSLYESFADSKHCNPAKEKDSAHFTFYKLLAMPIVLMSSNAALFSAIPLNTANGETSSLFASLSSAQHTQTCIHYTCLVEHPDNINSTTTNNRW